MKEKEDNNVYIWIVPPCGRNPISALYSCERGPVAELCQTQPVTSAVTWSF